MAVQIDAFQSRLCGPSTGATIDDCKERFIQQNNHLARLKATLWENSILHRKKWQWYIVHYFYLLTFQTFSAVNKTLRNTGLKELASSQRVRERKEKNRRRQDLRLQPLQLLRGGFHHCHLPPTHLLQPMVCDYLHPKCKASHSFEIYIL